MQTTPSPTDPPLEDLTPKALRALMDRIECEHRQTRDELRATRAELERTRESLSDVQQLVSNVENHYRRWS